MKGEKRSRVVQSRYKSKVVACIDKFWKEHHYSPSIRDICRQCGVPSTSYVRQVLTSLQEEGMLSMTGSVARSIVPRWVAERLTR